jgi:hypothetical protein
LSAPTRGETFDILINDRTDPIVGQFNEGDNVVGAFGGHTMASTSTTISMLTAALSAMTSV